MGQIPHAKSRGLTEGPRLCLKGTPFHLASGLPRRGWRWGFQRNGGAGTSAFPGRWAQGQRAEEGGVGGA